MRDAAISASKAHQSLYESMTETAGAVVTATGKLDAQNDTLLQTAATARGPAKQAIIEYILQLNQIPDDKKTDIIAAIRAGDLETAKRLLDDASVTRTAAYQADVNNASAAQTRGELDQIAKDRTATVFVQADLAAAQARISSFFRWLGSPAAASTGVGATATASTRSASPVYNVTNNVIVPRIPTGRELERVSQRWSRLNGRG